MEQAVARLSRNPKGYFLAVFSDCHLPNTRKTLTRILELDKTIQAAAEKHRKDTLVLMTADHSYDLATLQLIGKIAVGKGPDGIYYDAATKHVFTNNHGSHDVSAIDAVTGELIGAVKREGDGEQAVIGADGLIYVNSEKPRKWSRSIRAPSS